MPQNDPETIQAMSRSIQRLRTFAERDFPQNLLAKLRVTLAAELGETCKTCGGHGLVSGFVFPDQGYDTAPCPDCAEPGESKGE